MDTVFTTRSPLTLASASPRRKEFLHSLGLEFTCISCAEVEEAPTPEELPHDYVQRLALHKARSVAPLVQDGAIIAADTDVFLNGTVLGKPADAEHAFAMLQSLAGKEHTVVTGCCVLVQDVTGNWSIENTFYSQATVLFASFPEAILRAYANSGEPLDKAGAYAIQGQGSFLVQQIHGSWTAVVGLPMAELVQCLLRHALIIPQE